MSNSYGAVNVIGRLGVGFTNQLANDMEAISFKIQRSRSSALGVVLGFKAEDSETTYGAGIKLFRNIYEEPNLRFFMSGFVAALSEVINQKTESGFQIDGTFGSEFHFTSLESLGFSMEFGVSIDTLGDGTTIQTAGHNFFKAAVHFYL